MKKIQILLVVLLQCSLVERPFRSCAAEPDVLPGPETQEMLRCGEQMLRIHKATFRFFSEQKRLPDFLSDLWPKYCEKEDFTCPASSRVGDQAWARRLLKRTAFRDPKLDSSTYAYEFIMKPWEGTTVTYHEYKSAQRDYFGLRFGEGDSIPLLRCFLHGETNVLNLAFGGKLFKSGLEWEEKFPLIHDTELPPEAVLPVRVKLEDPIPPRRPGLPSELLDLTPNYNALITSSWIFFPGRSNSVFAGLTQDPRFLRNLKFDVRGVIQLKGSSLYRPFPLEEKIRLGRKAGEFRLLLSAYGKATPGDTIAQVRVNFADGASVSFSVDYGTDVLDWSADPAQNGGNQITEKVAWVGQRQTEEGKLETVRLYEFTRDNPNPEKEIASIDFAVAVVDSVVSKSAPALFAITLESPP